MTTLFAEPTVTIDPMPKHAKRNRRPPPPKSKRPKQSSKQVTAETLAAGQREISVSEFFAKNRHLLGFDNPRKALLTTVKEAVDNAIDACEEAGYLPDLFVQILQKSETRFKVIVRDNGPGIVRKQIDNIFGKLLYGSKFHRLKMSRGQQGIGISAAGMYGLMTTGKPVLIISKTGKRKPAHEVLLKMDTSKNRANIVSDTEHSEDDKLFADGHGTQVVIELDGRYQKGKQSIDEYLEQTAIANPHAQITYVNPLNEKSEYPRTLNELPTEPREIKPHPKGIELGTLIQMLERTESKKVGAFLQNDFCRVGPGKAKEICKKAGITNLTWVKHVGHAEAEAIYNAIHETPIMAPPTDCLVPIGSKALLAGLLKEVKAECYAASCRPPAVYRGNPFQIEVGLAYGGQLSGEEPARVIRYANRVPLLYQQSACCSYKSIIETNWRNYNLTQPRDAIPVGPLVIMIHMASVWVPFTSESKEAIADYDEIRKEMTLALKECGRKMGIYLRRRQRMRHQTERRSVLERYIGEVATSCHAITGADAKKIYQALFTQAKKKTAEADQVLDDEGRVIKGAKPKKSSKDDTVIIVEERQLSVTDDGEESNDGTLFGKSTKRTKKKKRKKRARS